MAAPPHHEADERFSLPTGRSAFLANAVAWIRPGDDADVCTTCGHDWAVEVGPALELVETTVARYLELLEQRDGMVRPEDGSWNATAYLWHLTDLARSWSERWVQLADCPGSRLVGWDPDELASVRGYRALPTVAATWALQEATNTFVRLTRQLDPLLPFEHGEWGRGHVTDGVRWIAHEYVHHVADVADRSVPVDSAGGRSSEG